MKKVFLIIALFFSISNLKAQEIDLEDLTKKWKTDLVLMRPVLEKMLSERPDMRHLDEENRVLAIDTALEQIAGNTIEYRKDGILLTVTSKGKTEGIWRYESGQLFTQNKGKEEKKFTILEITKSNLHLRSEDGKDLYMVSQ
jgi:hypothetical protein